MNGDPQPAMLVVVVFGGRGYSMPYDAILGDSGWRTKEDNDTHGAGGRFGWLGSEI